MRQTFYLLSIIFLPLFCSSQLIVSNEKLNILYVGVDNSIQFAVPGYNSKELLLIASCGMLITRNDKTIWRICNEKCSYVKFSCYLKSSKGRKLLGSSDYRIKSCADPVIMNPFIMSNHYSSPNIFKIPDFVRVEHKNFDFDISFTVKQFKIEIYKSSGDTLKMTNLGPQLSEQLFNEIGKMKKGESLLLYDVIVKNECELSNRELNDKVSFTMTFPE
jgi:hypothetical protein